MRAVFQVGRWLADATGRCIVWLITMRHDITCGLAVSSSAANVSFEKKMCATY